MLLTMYVTILLHWFPLIFPGMYHIMLRAAKTGTTNAGSALRTSTAVYVNVII